jgi:hypothetical protein
MKRLLLILFVLLWALPASAAIRTVGSGKTHATIQACVDVAQAGDTCLVYAGTYAGATMARSGLAGSRITLIADTLGAQPVITSNITIGTYDYITVQGFYFEESSVSASSGATYLAIVGNTFANSNGVALAPVADHVLIDGNTFVGNPTLDNDFINQWGWYWVIRNNIVSDVTRTGTEHLDFWQTHCGNSPQGQFSLVENNLYSNIMGGSTIHFMLWHIDSCVGDPRVNYIVRHNRLRGGGSQFFGIDDTSAGSDVGRVAVYNNTVGDTGSARQFVSPFELTAHDGILANNIAYRSLGTEYSIIFVTDTAVTLRNNLAYDPGFTYSATTPFSTCIASAGCKMNQNPLLTDYAGDDFAVQAKSPAIEAGGALTTVAVADTGSGTSLVVGAAYPFQPGWAGTQADWIAVGTTTNVAQIASIDYDTNTITLASGITRNDGDAVWLYKKSDGARVILGAAPDIGAVPYYASTPAAPASVSVTGAAPVLQWNHAGTGVAEFKYVLDGQAAVTLGYPEPSGATFQAALPFLSPGAHSLTLQACNGGGCGSAATITVVKL